MRIIRRVLTWVLGIVLGLILIVYLLLQTSFGRGIVRDIALGFANDAIAGEIELEEISSVSIHGLSVRGVVLKDLEGRTVFSLAELSVEIDLWDIITGDIRVDQIAVTQPEIALYLTESGSYSLLDAVASTSPPSDEPEPEPDSGPSTLVLHVPEITITGGDIFSDDPTMAGLGLADLEFRASAAIEGEDITFDLTHFSFRITGENEDNRENNGDVLWLEPMTAHVNLGDGLQAELDFALVNTRDHVRLQVSVDQATSDAPMVLDAQLDVAVHRDLLASVGQDELSGSIPEFVRTQLSATGPLDALDIDGLIETPAGDLSILANIRNLGEGGSVHIETEDLALADLLEGLPPHIVTLALDVDLSTTTLEPGAAIPDDPNPEDTDAEPVQLRHVIVNLDNLWLDGDALPAFSTKVTLGPDAIELHTLQLPHLEDRFEISGRYEMAGVVVASIFIDSLDLADDPFASPFLPPGLAGIISTNWDIRLELTEEPTFSATGELELESAGMADLSVDRFRLAGDASGPLMQPTVGLEIEVQNLEAAGNVIELADLNINGGPETYSIDGGVTLAGGPTADLDLVISPTPTAITVSGTLGLLHGDEALTASLRDIVYELSGAVQIGRLRLEHTEVDMTVTGHYDFSSGGDVEIEIDRANLDILDGRLGLPAVPIGGPLSGHVHFRGTPERPNIDLALLWHGNAGPIDDGAVDLSLRYGRDSLTTRAQISLGDAATFSVRGSGELDPAAEMMDGLFSGQYSLGLDVDVPDLAVVAEMLGVEIPVESGAISAHIEGGGSVDNPNLRMQLAVQQLVAMDQPAIDFDADVVVSPDNVTLNLTVEDERDTLVVTTADIALGLEAIIADPMSMFDVDATVDLTVGPVSIRRLRQRVDGIPLDQGEIEVELRWRGTLSDPDLTLAVRGSDLAGEQIPEIDIDFEMRADADEVEGELSVVDSGDRGLGELVRLDWITGAGLSDVMEDPLGIIDARQDLTLALGPIDIEDVREIVPGIPLTGGMVEANLRVLGRVTSANIDLLFQGHHLAMPGRPEVDIDLAVSQTDDEVVLEAEIRDVSGNILALDAQMAHTAIDFMEAESGPLALILEGGWGLTIDVPVRYLDTLGAPFDELAPVEFGLRGEMGQDVGATPRGQIIVDVAIPLEDWIDERDLEECGGEGTLSTVLVLDADPEKVRVRMNTRLRDESVMRLDARTTEDLAEALFGDESGLPAIDAALMIDGFDLAGVPQLCGRAGGLLNGAISINDLLGDAPSLDGWLLAENLDLGADATTQLDTVLVVEGGRADVSTTLTQDDGHLHIALEAPVIWDGSSPAPSLGEGDVLALIDIENFATESLSGLVPYLRQGDGRIDGELEVVISEGSIIPNGSFHLRNVDLMVPGVDQRLQDLTGHILLTPEALVLDRIRAQDRDGVIEIDGRIAMVDLAPTLAEIEIAMESFPMRSAGTIAATIDSHVDIRADLSAEQTAVEVVLREVDVRLPDSGGGPVQSLEVNGDIVFVDDLSATELSALVMPPPEELPDDEVPDDEVPETELPEGELTAESDSSGLTEADADGELAATPDTEEPQATAPLQLHLDATSPFWVHRSDFTVQVSLDLNIVMDEHGVRIQGPITMRRGSLSLLTKNFILEAGSIEFTGSAQPNPILDIAASHELSRYPGDTVTVAISGYLSRPQLVFSTTLAGVESEAEIIELLVTGRSSQPSASGDGDAGQQVSSMLSGLMAGVLSMAARSQVGSSLPVIAVETGDRLGDVQVRAGFSADDIIPSFMNDVVTGAYIEGYVGTSETEGGNRGTTGGVMLELYFRNGWLTSTSFQPPTNWTLDILWQP